MTPGGGPISLPVTVTGGDGNNAVGVETTGPVSIDLGAGNDLATAVSGGPISITTGPGTDQIVARSTTPGTTMSVDGGDGIDHIDVFDPGSSATVLGDGGADTIRVGGGPNTIDGGDGNDALLGGTYDVVGVSGLRFKATPRLADGDRDTYICGAGHDVLGTIRLLTEDSFAPDCPPYGAQTYATGTITLNGAKSRVQLPVRVPFKERFTDAALYRIRDASHRSAVAMAHLRKPTTTVGGRATLGFDLTASARKALAARHKVTLTIDGVATGIGVAEETAGLEVAPPIITIPFNIRHASRP